MRITGIVIPADSEQAVYTLDFERSDFKAMQEVVGGPFDVVDTDNPAVSVWLNDEGIINGLPQNARATMFVWTASSALRGIQGYFGDILVTGKPNDEGETTTVSADMLRLFFHTKQYKVEVQFKGEDYWRADDSTFEDYWVALHWALTVASAGDHVAEVRVSPA